MLSYATGLQSTMLKLDTLDDCHIFTTHADRQGVNISFTVCLCACMFVFLCVCTSTDFRRG